jgi:anaphase-promoting complex subunit 5
VLARCIIASADEDQGTKRLFALQIKADSTAIEPALRQAVAFLQQSESDYQSIELLRPLMDVQYLLSLVYHNLDMEKEREEAAKRHFETERRRKELEVVVFDSEVDEVWKLVSGVGTALAAR